MLEQGDSLTVTAQSVDFKGMPALISISGHRSDARLLQALKDMWKEYSPSPQTREFTVSRENALRGDMWIFINASSGGGIFVSDKSEDQINLKVRPLVTKIDDRPAKITQLIIKKDGKVVDPKSISLKLGDEIEAYLEAISTDGSKVRGFLHSGDASEPFFQKVIDIKNLFISDQAPLYKKFKISRANALRGLVSISGAVWDGDGVGTDSTSVTFPYSDDYKVVHIPVEKLSIEDDTGPAKVSTVKVSKVTVSIQKKNGNVVESSARPQVFDGSQGKGSIATPGKKSPGAAGAKAQ